MTGTYGEQITALESAATTATQVAHTCAALGSGEVLLAAKVSGELLASCASGLYTIARDAVAHGQVGSSQAGSLYQWLRAAAPAMPPEEVGAIARAVRELAVAGREDFDAAVAEGRISARSGMTCAREWEQLKDLVTEESAGEVRDELITVAGRDGVREALKLRPKLLAQHGNGKDLQDDHDRLKPFVSLSSGRRDEQGLISYALVTDPEGHAVLEAAISSFSQPRPAADGSADPRSVENRRAEALIDVLRGCDRQGAAPGSAGSAKATVVVTIGVADLEAATGAGTVVGSLATGTLLGAETVAKLACSADLIAMIVGEHGQPLTLGRRTRFFSSAQVKALWVRDAGCTFPGCRAPAFWCDAHHLQPWSCGGGTDLDNGALLCGRHHTVVHRDRLRGEVIDGVVHWVTSPATPGAPATPPCDTPPSATAPPRD